MVFSVAAETGYINQDQTQITSTGKFSDSPLKLLGAGIASEENEEDDALDHPQLLDLPHFYDPSLLQTIYTADAGLHKHYTSNCTTEKPIYLLNQLFRI